MLDAGEIRTRYEAAAQESVKWMSQLQKAYEYVMPNRANFTIKDRQPGQRRNTKQLDATAALAAEKFSSSMQQLLFPSGKHWAALSPGRKVMNGELKVSIPEIRTECQKWEDLFFDKLDHSNFQLVAFQTLLESTISTGVMLINEGTANEPFIFKAIPLAEVSLEPGPHDTVSNVYRKYKLKGEVIQQTWPKAEISNTLKNRIDRNPNDEIELLEGTVLNINGKPNKQYCYFVMEFSSNEYILYEERPYSPWVIIRQKVLAGETFGRGKIFDLLPFINMLQQMAHNEFVAASFNAQPIFYSHASGDMNIYNARIQPGSIIPVAPVAGGGQSFGQLPIKADPTYTQLTRSDLVRTITEAMNINPTLPSAHEPGSMTATEVNARQTEWVRNNQALVARAIYEGPRQIFNVCWQILHRFGLVPAPKVDGDHIKVDFISAITELQGEMEVQRLAEAQQAFQQILGPQMAEAATVYGMDVTKIPTFVLDKLKVNPEVIQDELSKSKMMQAMQSQGGQQPPNAQPPQGAAPAPVSQ